MQKFRFQHLVPLLLAAALLSPAAASALDVQWSVEGGTGYMIEMHDSVGVSPRIGGTALVRLSERLRAGVLADYVPYNTVRPEDSGSQWRTMALLQWEMYSGFLSDRVDLFGQIGLGVGHVEYTDERQVSIFTREVARESDIGPAVRLGFGCSVAVSDRVQAYGLVSLERMDMAIFGNYLNYPSMAAFSLGLSMRLPYERAAAPHVQSTSSQQSFERYR